MKGLKFIYYMLKKFPLLAITNIVLSASIGILGACSLLTFAPVVDLFIHSDIQQTSPLTIKVMNAIKTFGLPATLKSSLVIFLIFLILGSGLQIFNRNF